MMSRVFLGLLMGTVSLGPALAGEGESNPTGPYLGLTVAAIDVFYDQDNIDFEPAAIAGILGLQAGYRLNENVRAELELSRQVNGSNVNNTDVFRLTLNGYYDFRETDKTLVPYIGGGLGVAQVEQGKLDEFTWHAELGTTININSTFAIVPSYRYVGVEPANGFTDDVLTIHSFRLGGRVSF